MSKKIIFLCLFLSIFVTSCGGFKKTSPDVPQNAQERARKNVEEGRGASIGGLLKGRKGTNYEFSTSNPLWRATLETLDFLPLSNVDYSGGVVITDWYSDNLNNNDSIKISVQFLSNQIRADSLKINIYKKACNAQNNCRVKLTESKIKNELLEVILVKAKTLEKNTKR
tara:strand:+ start:360 stop:866 length:507 start_codon:yes stop_codon:yes gene_type:complete